MAKTEEMKFEASSARVFNACRVAAHSDVFGHSVRSFRTPCGAVGGRVATDVCVSR